MSLILIFTCNILWKLCIILSQNINILSLRLTFRTVRFSGTVLLITGIRKLQDWRVSRQITFRIWRNENPLISQQWRVNRPISLKFQITPYSISPFSSPFLYSSCDARVWLDAVAESDPVKCNYSVNKSWLPVANRRNIRHVSTKLRFLPTKFLLAAYLCMSNYRL